VLLPTLRTSTWPELFLSPRGLITILLFFSIPENLVEGNIILENFHINIVPGIFLFIILGSALFMSNALIGFKKMESEKLKEELGAIDTPDFSEVIKKDEDPDSSLENDKEGPY